MTGPAEGAAAGAKAKPARKTHAAGELIVKFKPGATVTSLGKADLRARGTGHAERW